MDQRLFNPSYLKQLCEEYHLQPSKDYGQNYLLSGAPIAAMLRAGDVSGTDTIVEVGPGFGVLTIALAEQAKHVIAFEIEKKLFGYWDKLQEMYPAVDMRWGNVLKEFPVMQVTLPDTYKVIANVPYHITALLLRLFLEAVKKPERIIVMVQREVADRICAKAGEMSLLSVSIQYYGKPKIVAKVAKGSFWPQPKVDSAVVAITSIAERNDAVSFFTLTRAGFANKRKQLWKNISDGLGLPRSDVRKAILDVVGNERARAQELTIDQWICLKDTLRMN
jgi:16S rRNA (adenine1518-N6/adenine1519-N6)-dimethyltransferase